MTTSSNEAKTPLATSRVSKDIQLKADQWQPIETAPKDGTEILLAHSNSMWIDEWVESDEGDYWMMCDQWATPEVPSHWMPLPALPVTITQAGASPKERTSTTVTDHDVVGSGLPESESSISSTLAEIRERRSKISPTPWTRDARITGYLSGDRPAIAVRAEISRHSWSPVCMVQPHLSGRYSEAGSCNPIEDAEFIANAPTDIDTLLGIIDSLKAENESLNRQIVLAKKLEAVRVRDEIVKRVRAMADLEYSDGDGLRSIDPRALEAIATRLEGDQP